MNFRQQADGLKFRGPSENSMGHRAWLRGRILRHVHVCLTDEILRKRDSRIERLVAQNTGNVFLDSEAPYSVSLAPPSSTGAPQLSLQLAATSFNYHHN